MKVNASSLAYAIALSILIYGLQQVQLDVNWINSLLQIPMVAGLIVLVLKLEDKRQASALVREETFRKIVNDLLGVIIELSSLSNPNTITSNQIRSIEEYLKSQKEQGR